MIITVTPNPSIDLLFDADALVWDDANRIESPRRRAGGQGINLTRAVHVLGEESVAVAFLGGHAGEELRAMLRQESIQCEAVPIAAETRVFVAARERSTGRALLLNSKGPMLGAADRARLLQQIETTCRANAATWLICSGSIPRGIGSDLYAAIARVAHRNGIRFMADCDGDALAAAVNEGCDLLAPNQHEAGRLLGAPVTTAREAAEAARSLLKFAPRVLIKLAESGAVLAEKGECWHAAGRNIAQGSAVGAGDAFLAAFLVADGRGETARQSLMSAVAAGGAVLLSSGADLLCREDYEAQLAQIEVNAL